MNKTLLLIIPLFFSFSSFSQQETNEILSSILSQNEDYQLYYKSVAPPGNWTPTDLLRKYEDYLTKAAPVIRNKLSQIVDETSLESIKKTNTSTIWEGYDWKVDNITISDTKSNPEDGQIIVYVSDMLFNDDRTKAIAYIEYRNSNYSEGSIFTFKKTKEYGWVHSPGLIIYTGDSFGR